MTDPTEQELAEYFAGKLGHKRDYPDHWNFKIDGHNYRPHEDYLAQFMFQDVKTAPIIAHLIQNYMEGEGYVWSLKKGNGYTADYELRENIKDAWKHHAIGNSDNKWLTNALAAWRTKEGK